MRPLNSLENSLIYLVLAIAIAGILYAGYLVRQILRESKGSDKMQQVWGYIRTGANAYLSSQFRIIAVLIAVLVVVLFFSVYVVNPTPYAIERFCPDVAAQARASVNGEAIRADVAQRNPQITGESLALLESNAVVYEEEAQSSFKAFLCARAPALISRSVARERSCSVRSSRRQLASLA